MLNNEQFEALVSSFEHIRLVKLQESDGLVSAFGSIHGAGMPALKEVNRLWDQQDMRPEGYFILDRESRDRHYTLGSESRMACVYVYELVLDAIDSDTREKLLQKVWNLG